MLPFAERGVSLEVEHKGEHPRRETRQRIVILLMFRDNSAVYVLPVFP